MTHLLLRKLTDWRERECERVGSRGKEWLSWALWGEEDWVDGKRLTSQTRETVRAQA